MQNKQRFQGKVWKFGDNIDTDIIAPAGTISFGLGDATEDLDVKTNAFRAVRPDFHLQVGQGDILVAGKNFGLGSHREPANRVLVSLGFRAVIAESVARLFFRNSVAIGFYTFQVPGILDFVDEGEELDVDVENAMLRNVTRGTELKMEMFSPLVRNIVDQGGILEVLKSRLAAEREAS